MSIFPFRAIKKTPHQGNGVPLVTTALRFNSASVVRFVTFAYFAVAQTLINKLSPHHKKTPHQGSFFMARPRRFERLTHSLEGCCSIQLS